MYFSSNEPFQMSKVQPGSIGIKLCQALLNKTLHTAEFDPVGEFFRASRQEWLQQIRHPLHRRHHQNHLCLPLPLHQPESQQGRRLRTQSAGSRRSRQRFRRHRLLHHHRNQLSHNHRNRRKQNRCNLSRPRIFALPLCHFLGIMTPPRRYPKQTTTSPSLL